MLRGVKIIERVSGRAPLGYRSPAGEFSEHTVDLMLEFGIRYFYESLWSGYEKVKDERSAAQGAHHEHGHDRERK